MTDTTEPGPIHQGTLDWAHSMQARNAEYRVGKLARQNHGELPSGHAALEQLRALVDRRLALIEARPPDSEAS
jgi:hypothetical protein